MYIARFDTTFEEFIIHWQLSKLPENLHSASETF